MDTNNTKIYKLCEFKDKNEELCMFIRAVLNQLKTDFGNHFKFLKHFDVKVSLRLISTYGMKIFQFLRISKILSESYLLFFAESKLCYTQDVLLRWI